MKILVTTLTALLTFMVTTTAQAFCGFYVAKADTSLFNQASQVVLVRDGDRTVITMANDFEGNVEDFAIVIPVPTLIEREQINVGDRAVIQHLDAYTSPRLVEYHDGNPCMVYDREEMMSADSLFPAAAKALKRSAHSRGVTIEAQYTVGEYDILILSAEESSGLTRWLNENDYKIPHGAKRVIDYLRQEMRFFVARVNLEEQSKLGYQYLRPLQVAYESDRFMLPIRLGTLNAKDKQELFVYALTRRDHQLSNREAAEQCGHTGIRRGRIRRLLSCDVREANETRKRTRGFPRICLGHGLVRSLCGRPAKRL
jgi:hypothetical protein